MDINHILFGQICLMQFVSHYMSKPGQSLSEKPCEPPFDFQDQQSFSLHVDSAEADKYGFGNQKDMDVNHKNHICSVKWLISIIV